MNKLSIKDLPLSGKKVLVRVDFNVPLKDDGSIADDTRIKASLPTIQYILDNNGSIILMSHLGKPKKKDPKLSLSVCAKRLSELVKQPVIMAPDCVGEEVERLAHNLKPKQILLLENLRFHAAEEHPEKDPNFAKSLAKLSDFYVNDAFGTAHRAHSSTATITKYFPHKAAAGFLLEKEIQYLHQSLLSPKRPFFAIVGGAKISTKLGVLFQLAHHVDALFIGGAMAYTFFKEQNIPIGNSLFEKDQIPEVKKILDFCKKKSIPLYLPVDLVITQKLEDTSPFEIISVQDGIPDGWEGVDIGPKTVELWKQILKTGKTIFWNGPLGVFEIKKFAKGTESIALSLSDLKATTIVGGGDSLAAIHALNLDHKFTHLSTGGGASLEYIELGTLPGIEALSEKI
jgi:phosphoglycerate kinase